MKAFHLPQNNPALAITGLLILILLALPLLFRHPAPHAAMQVLCTELTHGCQFTLSDQRPVKITFSAPPSGLQAFTVQVTVAGAQQVTAAFAMPDMDMGDNRYRLQQTSPQLWQGKIILPVCVSGKHDWQLNLSIDGTDVRIPFRA